MPKAISVHDVRMEPAGAAHTGDAWKYVRTVRPELYDRLGDEPRLNLASVRTSCWWKWRRPDCGESRMRAPVESVSVRLTPRRRRLASLATRRVPGRPPHTVQGRPLRDIKDMLAVKHLETELARGVALGVLRRRKWSKPRDASSPRVPSRRFHARLGAA